MALKKYRLNQAQRKYLRSKRQEISLPAETLSKQMLNKSKSWLAMIERGEVATIKHDDLVALLGIIHNKPKDDIVSEGTLDDFLSLEDKHTIASWYKSSRFDAYKDYSLSQIDALITDEWDSLKGKMFSDIDKVADRDGDNGQRFSYVIYEIIRNMSKNYGYNALLYCLFNSVKLYELENLSKDIHSTEVENIFDMLDRFNDYGFYGGLKAVTDTSKIEAVALLKKQIGVCNGLLTELLMNPDSGENVKKYNEYVQAINDTVQQYKIQKNRLSEIDIDAAGGETLSVLADKLVNDITEKHSVELLKLSQNVLKFEKNAQKSVEDDLLYEFSGIGRENSLKADRD